MTEAQVAVLLGLLFWVSTYFLFSLRSILFPPVDPDVVSAKRLTMTLFGAMLFLLAIIWTRSVARQGSNRRLLLAIGSTIVASVALLIFRLAYNDLEDPSSFALTDHGRWILVWSGYFLAGVALFSPEKQVRSSPSPPVPVAESPPEPDQAIWVQRNKRSIKVAANRIEWVEAQGNYVYAHAGEASGLLRSSLASIEHRLSAEGFIRVHRSALCQKRHIQAVKRIAGGASVVILTSGAEVAVGRRYAPNVTALMSA